MYIWTLSKKGKMNVNLYIRRKDQMCGTGRLPQDSRQRVPWKLFIGESSEATYLDSSPGLIAMIFPSTTAWQPRIAAETKSLCTWTNIILRQKGFIHERWLTLNIARSRINRSGKVFFDNSLVICNSSFQSRTWPGIWSSCPSLLILASTRKSREWRYDEGV